MKIYSDGMTLMRDTGSLTNALMENKKDGMKVGDTFAELMWTDRTLWQVTEVVVPGRKFKAQRVETYMENWTDGTEYPREGADGKYILQGDETTFERKRKYWYRVGGFGGGSRVHFSWGAKHGYRDPSF